MRPKKPSLRCRRHPRKPELDAPADHGNTSAGGPLMGNGCAAPVTVRWSNPRMVVRNRAVRLSHAKNGEKVDLERTGRLDETAQFDQPASRRRCSPAST